MAEMSEAELDARHAEKMKKRRAARDKILASKTEERGLIIVHTGRSASSSSSRASGRPASAPCSTTTPIW